MSALDYSIDPVRRAAVATGTPYIEMTEGDLLPPVQRLSFAQYVQGQYNTPQMIMAAFSLDAEAAGLAVGVQLPELPILDGAPHDATNPDTGKNDQRQGYYAEFKADKDGLTLPVVTFNSFREGGKVAYWSPRDLLWSEYQAHKDGEPRPPKFNPEEYRANAAALAEVSAKKRAEIAKVDLAGRAFVAQSASRAWEAAQPDTEHPYLTRKGIAAAGARVAASELKGALYDQAKGEIFPNGELCKKGELLIPVYNAGGELVNIQRIDADGKKRFLKGGETKGCFYRLEGTEPALIAEGFADAATINKALGCAVYVGFSAYNLKHVCSTQLDIGAVAADDGEAGTKAAEATGLPYLAPPNPHGVSGYDWNDYGTANGLDAVREALNALTPVERKPAIANGWDLADEAKAPTYLIKDMLEEDAHGILGGSTGAYKSFVVLRMAHSICSGEAFMGRKVYKSGAVVYVCGEGQGGLPRRLRAINLHLGEKPKHMIHIINQGVNLNSAESMAALGVKLAEIKPVLVIFDTFATLAGGVEENNNAEVSSALSLVRDTCRAAGASSLIVHHYGKDVDKGFRGAGSFTANVDFALTARRAGDLLCEVGCIKMKEGEEFAPFNVGFEVVRLGIYNQEGEETTTLVAVPSDRVAGTNEPSTGRSELDRAFGALYACMTDQKQIIEAGGRTAKTIVVEWKDWKAKMESAEYGIRNASRAKNDVLLNKKDRVIITGKSGFVVTS